MYKSSLLTDDVWTSEKMRDIWLRLSWAGDTNCGRKQLIQKLSSSNSWRTIQVIFSVCLIQIQTKIKLFLGATENTTQHNTDLTVVPPSPQTHRSLLFIVYSLFRQARTHTHTHTHTHTQSCCYKFSLERQIWINPPLKIVPTNSTWSEQLFGETTEHRLNLRVQWASSWEPQTGSQSIERPIYCDSLELHVRLLSPQLIRKKKKKLTAAEQQPHPVRFDLWGYISARTGPSSDDLVRQMFYEVKILFWIFKMIKYSQ